MTIWSWLWVACGVAVGTLECVALVNSTRGDTLSEHIWAWLGVRRQGTGAVVTPKWTLRVARTILLSGLLWVTLHFVTGGWV